jgi:hypothetical protein
MTMRIDRTLVERKCRMALKSIRKGYDGGQTAKGRADSFRVMVQGDGVCDAIQLATEPALARLGWRNPPRSGRAARWPVGCTGN